MVEGPIANDAEGVDPGPSEAATLPLSLGPTLASTVRVWIRNLPVVTATSALIYVPTAAWTAWLTGGSLTPSTYRAWLIGTVLLNLLLRPWLASGLAPSLSAEDVRARFPLGRCWLDTMRGTFTALLVLLRVAGMSIAVFMVPQAIYQGRNRALGEPTEGADVAFAGSGGVVGVALTLGFFLFFVWAAARAFVAVPAARVEGLGVNGAWALSLRRTLGLRWKLAGAILAWAALDIGGMRLISLALGGRSLSAWMWTTVGWDVLVTTPLFAVLMCVVDRDLRHAALGPRPATLERVFE